MKRIIPIFFCFATCFGEQLRDWPDPEATWTEIDLSELPKGISPQDTEDPERPLTKVSIWKVDINGDGTLDIVLDTHRGGSAGPYINVYCHLDAAWVETLSEQGGVVPLGQIDGIPRLEVWGRAGGGEYRVTRYRYQDGRFQEDYTEWLKHRDDDQFVVTGRELPKQSAEQGAAANP